MHALQFCSSNVIPRSPRTLSADKSGSSIVVGVTRVGVGAGAVGEGGGGDGRIGSIGNSGCTGLLRQLPAWPNLHRS